MQEERFGTLCIHRKDGTDDENAASIEWEERLIETVHSVEECADVGAHARASVDRAY